MKSAHGGASGLIKFFIDNRVSLYASAAEASSAQFIIFLWFAITAKKIE